MITEADITRIATQLQYVDEETVTAGLRGEGWVDSDIHLVIQAATLYVKWQTGAVESSV